MINNDDWETVVVEEGTFTRADPVNMAKDGKEYTASKEVPLASYFVAAPSSSGGTCGSNGDHHAQDGTTPPVTNRQWSYSDRISRENGRSAPLRARSGPMLVTHRECSDPDGRLHRDEKLTPPRTRSGPSPAAVLNGRISQEDDPKHLLRLVDDEIDNFDPVNVATALHKLGNLGNLCGSESFPRHIAEDDAFRGLMFLVRDMCGEEKLQARQVANITYAVAKMMAAGNLSTAGKDVKDTLVALERRAIMVSPDMIPQHVSNCWWAFSTLGWCPAHKTLLVLEAAVVRVGPYMNAQDVSNTLWSVATLEVILGCKAQSVLEAAVVRERLDMTARGAWAAKTAYAKLRLTPGAAAWTALEAAMGRVGPAMNSQDTGNTLWGAVTLGAVMAQKAKPVYITV